MSQTATIIITPTRSRRYVLLVAVVAAISGLLFGFDTAVINGALVLLRTEFALTDFQTEIAASALLAGCLLGAIVAGAVSDRLGRRKSLVAAALLFAVSSIGAAVAGGLSMFCISRVTGGLAIGLASALTPVYISEIAPAQNRGRLVSLNQLAIVSGILIAYLTNWRLSLLGESGWRWMFAVGIVPSTALLVGLAAIPESPRWLIAHGHVAQGRAVLGRIMGPAAVDEQVAEIETAAATERGASLAALFAPTLRNRLFVAVMLAILQQISGINTVLYYGSIIFNEHFSGKSVSTAIGANVVVGMVNLVCTVVAMVFIDRWGRRALLLAASGGMAFCLGVLALTFHLGIPAILFACVLLYVGFFAIGLGPGVWVYMAEIFPTSVRGRAMSVATTALWTACFAVTLTFISILHTAGISGAFTIYGALSLCTFGFVWKWVPETRGRSLEEIQRTWG